MQYHEIEGPLFPAMPRPLQDRITRTLVETFIRWAVRGAMHQDDVTTLSRHTGGHA